MSDKLKTCNSCKLSKIFDCFGNNKNKPDGKQPCCKECCKKRDKKHYDNNVSRREKIKKARLDARRENQELVYLYLLLHPCVDCGERNPLFLDFDHVRGKKRICVSTASRQGWSKSSLEKEIDKCDIRCIKCHRIKTAKEQGWYEKYTIVI